MGELRYARSERLEQQDVLGRVREVILAADDMAYRHGRVVYRHGEVVQGSTVPPHDHQVAAQGARVDLDVAAHDVVEGNRPIQRDPEAHHRLAPIRLELGNLGRGQVSAASVVASG